MMNIYGSDMFHFLILLKYVSLLLKWLQPFVQLQLKCSERLHECQPALVQIMIDENINK